MLSGASGAFIPHRPAVTCGVWTIRGSCPAQPAAAGELPLTAGDLLVKTDRMTMANGIEARSPFLDRALVDYAATLPDTWKLSRRGHTKVILREAFADLIPDRINRRAKMGFGVPLDRWFRGELRAYVRDTLLASDAGCHTYLDRASVEGLIRRHESGEANLGQQLWCLLAFERWLRLLPEWRRTGCRSPRGGVRARLGRNSFQTIF